MSSIILPNIGLITWFLFFLKYDVGITIVDISLDKNPN